MTLNRKALISLLLRALVGCTAIGIAFLISDPVKATLSTVVIFSLCLVALKLDFTNIWVVFAGPWVIILAFSTLYISNYSRELSRETVIAVAAVLGIGFALLPKSPALRDRRAIAKPLVNSRVFIFLLLFYTMFCVLNVALAGYIPLVRAVTQGDSGYMDFGVKGLYGLFNAFANAFGLTAFYLWMQHRNTKLYKYSFFFVLIIFILFVTRQNMMSLMVEVFILYCLNVKRISGLRLAVLIVFALVIFSVIGDLRLNGDIADAASISDEYRWIPRPVIWLFAYCYFNILNLDNVIAATVHPAFDGSSAAALLPSFLRPDVDDGSDLLEVSSFTVDSFISPIYHDIGLAGLCVLFALFCLSVRWYMSCRRRGDEFLGETGYAVLYFCFLFSFFVNFWFYLPVIFQLAFMPAFKRMLFRRPVRLRVAVS